MLILSLTGVIFNMFTYAGVFVLGLIGAYLVNYFSDVLPIKRKLGLPVCVRCHREISWETYFLKSKCSHCRRKFKIRRWITIVIYPVLFLAVFINPSPRFGFWISVILLLYSGVIFIIDVEYRAILHPTSLFGAFIFFALGIYLHGWWTTLLGGFAGFGIMLALYYLGAVFGKWMAKRRGENYDEPALGFGDVNLAGVIGLGLGWPGILAGLILAIMLGGIISGVYLLYTLLTKQYRPALAVPYAPFIILAAIFLLFRP